MPKSIIQPPDQVIRQRQQKISKFMADNINNQPILGWQLLVRTIDDGAIVESDSPCNNRVFSISDIDPMAIAMNSYFEQNRFEICRHKVRFECVIAECSPNSRNVIGLTIKKALENYGVCRQEITAITNVLKCECNIKTVGDLLCFDMVHIKSLHRIGPKRMQLLLEALKLLHAELGMLKKPRTIASNTVIIEMQLLVEEKL